MSDKLSGIDQASIFVDDSSLAALGLTALEVEIFSTIYGVSNTHSLSLSASHLPDMTEYCLKGCKISSYLSVHKVNIIVLIAIVNFSTSNLWQCKL